MKSFKKFVAEVAQPKPEEEKRFKDQHEYEVVAHPVAEPHQHTGEIQKAAQPRIADEKDSEKNYDKAVKNPEKRMATEEVEQIDEISKELAGRYIKKAQVSSADAGMDTASQDRDIRQRGIKTFLKRRKGVDSAVKRLMNKESTADDRARYDAADDKNKKKVTLPKAPWDKKDEELSAKQKKIDLNKNGKVDGQDLAMLRKKKNEEVDQIDEISKDLAKKVLDKRDAQADKLSNAAKRAQNLKNRSADKAKKRYDREMGTNMRKDDEIKKHIDTSNRADTISHNLRHVARKADKKADKTYDYMKKRGMKTESVDLDETTSSAMKKMVTQTGPDGKTRTVMKKAKNDRMDDRGQDKIATRESAELEEAVKIKRGPLRLKDGSQIMVSKEDADLLSRMFSDLSPNNQRQMQKVMMMDKAGFEEIRGFAREAL